MAIRQLHYCTQCGTPLTGEVNYCPSCGHRLRPAPTVIPRRPPLRPPLRPPFRPPLRPPLRVASPPSPGQLQAKAPIERRLAAAVVDLLLAGVAALVAWALGAELSVILTAGAHHGSALAWSLVVAVLAGYQPLFWARSGRTPGMQLLGLRVLAADGTAAGAGRALARTGAMVLSALPLGFGFAGAWRDPSGRTWHDRLSGTRVVGPPRL